MYKLTAAVLVAVFVLTLAVAAFASHDPNAMGCERAHECGYEQAWVRPDGQTRTGLYAWTLSTDTRATSELMEL